MKGMDAFTENVKCPKCESPHVVKAGTRNGHQRYLCRACSKKFPANGKAAGRRIRADRMGEAIRLFYAGMSYKQIAENLEETYDVPALSTATIYQWVRDYTKDALKEMEGHKAHAGGRWLVDEMQLRVGGREYWVWNVMDESTRYLLASQLTKERDARAAESVLMKAAGAAVQHPKAVTTALADYYVPAVEKVLPEARHFRSPWVTNPENNQFLPGGARARFGQRSKALRRLSSKESVQLYLDGWTQTYNHFRTPESMAHRLPGRAAEVNPPVKSWADVVWRRDRYGWPERAGTAEIAKVEERSDTASMPEQQDISDGVDVLRHAPQRHRALEGSHPGPRGLMQTGDMDSGSKQPITPDAEDLPTETQSSPKRSSGKPKKPAPRRRKVRYKPTVTGLKSGKSRLVAPRKTRTYPRPVRKA